ncbi:MAG: heavy-metal-associated domain-containing protein [Chitinophagaceae bacterium]|nr:heavy-metal-associated domain-containing protein [Chitinophagaceae bacterium]
MKNTLMILAMSLLGLSANAQFTKAELQATGLTCAMCSNAINKALQGLPFVQSVKADIKNSAFHIVFKETTATDIDAIKNAVEGAGFGMGSLKLTGQFDGVQIENDTHVKIGDKNFHFLEVSSQVLQGEKTIRVVDKDFLTAKQFRKFSTASKMKCVETGKAANCCSGVQAETRMYHVTI